DAFVKWYRSQQYYDSGQWRGTKKIDGGGALMNQAIHAVDLLQWFGGKVSTVYAFGDTLARKNIEVEDTLSCAIKFANGAMGVIEAATSVFKGFPKRIEILGTDGAIVLEEENIVRWDFADEKPQDKEIREKFANISNASGGSDPKAISIEGHILQYRDFVSAIENKTKLSIDGVEAKKAVSLIEAIYKSVETGKPVVL
ncbi:MAG: gfo/Idh/MocA family oxidoreductase, partial [Elusimicrobiota bacterium]|nr:gfo/Idh/MocA family oxidoreductase [Elusimicrobiota bacterium]